MSAIKLIADTFLLCIPDLNFIVHDMNRKLFSNSIITIVSILITPFIFSSCNEENEDNPYPDYPTTSDVYGNNNLSPNTKGYVFVVVIDNDGKIGQLQKKEVTTTDVPRDATIGFRDPLVF